MRQESERRPLEEIKGLLPTLSRAQILELEKHIHEYLETSMLMRGAETSFSEWNDPEEELYEAEL
jgi:hypothetical protein